jgi:hypothetical protein
MSLKLKPFFSYTLPGSIFRELTLLSLLLFTPLTLLMILWPIRPQSTFSMLFSQVIQKLDPLIYHLRFVEFEKPWLGLP